MNILIISHMYPCLDGEQDNRDSFFLHNYVRNWSKEGNNVRVEHLALIYPRFFNWLCHKIKRLNNYRRPWGNYRKVSYSADGALIERRPMMKFIPHGMYPDAALRRNAADIQEQLQKDGFVPDIVVCDYLNPGIKIYRKLNFPSPVKSFVIIHGTDAVFLQKFPGFAEEVKNITKIGYRSKALEKRCVAFWGERDSFIIPSGIEKKYIPDRVEPRTGISRILVVASFHPDKFVDSVITAVGSLNQKGGKYELTVIGDGALREELKQLAASFGEDGWCDFTGKISKDEVLQYMRGSDLFVLVSRIETFGMVYVEAMSQGCVTIGSRGEGIDGVIIDGQNGFLLPAGDSAALERKIEEIGNMDPEEIRRLSKAAAETGRSLTEEELAERILKEMCG